MKQLVFSLLILLTIAAILQPLILFYLFRGDFIGILFPVVGLLCTFFLIVLSLSQKKNLPKIFFIWSLLIFLIGLVSLFSIQERWIYTADGLFFMKQREEIVAEIKRSQIPTSTHWQKAWIPVSINNQIQIELKNGVYREIRFPTVTHPFFGYYSRGVLYSELAERDIQYDRQYEVGGEITEYKLTVRKIKPGWYFYTYEQNLIHD